MTRPPQPARASSTASGPRGPLHAAPGLRRDLTAGRRGRHDPRAVTSTARALDDVLRDRARDDRRHAHTRRGGLRARDAAVQPGAALSSRRGAARRHRVVETASADIDASDLSGTKSFRTASGELSLRRLAGAVDVETVSGEIEHRRRGAARPAAAKSVSGDISVRVPSTSTARPGHDLRRLRLDAELAGDGPFAVRSISGDVTIVGRAGLPGRGRVDHGRPVERRAEQARVARPAARS